MANYGKYCKGTIPRGHIITCLAKHMDTLSDAYKKVVELEQKKMY